MNRKNRCTPNTYNVKKRIPLIIKKHADTEKYFT